MNNKYGQLEIKDSIAIIWLDMENSPQNIISPEMISYVDPFLKEVAENNDIKAVSYTHLTLPTTPYV